MHISIALLTLGVPFLALNEYSVAFTAISTQEITTNDAAERSRISHHMFTAILVRARDTYNSKPASVSSVEALMAIELINAWSLRAMQEDIEISTSTDQRKLAINNYKARLQKIKEVYPPSLISFTVSPSSPQEQQITPFHFYELEVRRFEKELTKGDDSSTR